MPDGKIILSTALDNKQLEKDLQSTLKKINALEKSLAEMGSGRNALAEQANQMGGKLLQKLAARAAGITIFFAVAPDGDADKVAVAAAHGFHRRGALGADRVAVGGVLHVAAGEDRAVAALERRTHGEFRVRHIRIFGGLLRHVHQFLIGHIRLLLFPPAVSRY